MAIAFRSSTTYTNGAGGVNTITKPSGTVSGDLILMFIASFGVQPNQTSFSPTFTFYDKDNLSQYGSVFYRIADGTEGSTFSVSTVPNTSIVCASYSGVNNSTPFDGGTGNYYPTGIPYYWANNATINLAAITTTVASDYIIACNMGVYANSTGYTASSFGGLTYRNGCICTHTGKGGPQNGTVDVGDTNGGVAAATYPSGTYTCTTYPTGNLQSCTFVIAIQPAGGGGGFNYGNGFMPFFNKVRV